ncbi:MAG: YfhO family protein, partial [Acidobacteria bacterium]|nr:YfhO family protein [Acidobacteriota bacterium]
KRRRRALGAVGVLGLLLALGGNGVLYRALYSFLPTVAQIRYPERFLLVTLVALALLAALGLDRLTDPVEGDPRRRMIGCAIVAGALFMLATSFAALPGLADRFLSSGAGVPAVILESDVGAVLRGATLRSVLWSFGEAAVLALCALVAMGRQTSQRSRIPAWGIVVVSGLSMTIAATPALSTADAGWVRARSPLHDVVEHGQGAPRVHHEPRPANLSVWGRTDELAWGFRYDRFIYALGSGHIDGVPSLFDPATDRMDLRTSSAIGRRLQNLPLDARLRVLGLGHVGYLLTYAKRDHPRLEEGPVLEGFSRPPLRVYRLRDPLPRARWVARAVPPLDPGDPLLSLVDPDFDPERAILLDGVDGTAENRGGPVAGQATIIEDHPERLRIRTESRAPGYLVVADAFAPGWMARIDGHPAELLRANGMFRAVRVEAGTHTVEMRYAPVSVRTGLWLSATGLLLTFGWAVGARRVG